MQGSVVGQDENKYYIQNDFDLLTNGQYIKTKELDNELHLLIYMAILIL